MPTIAAAPNAETKPETLRDSYRLPSDPYALAILVEARRSLDRVIARCAVLQNKTVPPAR
jgi:hypothetical protein